MRTHYVFDGDGRGLIVARDRDRVRERERERERVREREGVRERERVRERVREDELDLLGKARRVRVGDKEGTSLTGRSGISTRSGLRPNGTAAPRNPDEETASVKGVDAPKVAAS